MTLKVSESYKDALGNRLVDLGREGHVKTHVSGGEWRYEFTEAGILSFTEFTFELAEDITSLSTIEEYSVAMAERIAELNVGPRLKMYVSGGQWRHELTDEDLIALAEWSLNS